MADFPDYKTVSVASLVPYARNSRTHNAAQIDKIAASIREIGFLNPIITDGQSGIIAGHGRVLAAQKLGLATLPVIEASHLTDAQRRARRWLNHTPSVRRRRPPTTSRQGSTDPHAPNISAE